MFDFLEEFPWYLGSLLSVFGLGFIAILGLFITRYFAKKHDFRAHHDVAGFTFGTIGVMYAVLLSYIVVDVHDRYNQIHHNIDIEANLVAELYRDSDIFPEAMKNNIKNLLRQYVSTTLVDNMEFTQSGKEDPTIHGIVSKLWQNYYSFQPETKREEIWYAVSINKLNEFNRTRLTRLFNNRESIGTMMWAMLIVGACITVSFMYFFTVDNFLMQAIMTAMLAAFIALMLFLISSLDTAFIGNIHVSPNHFAEVLDYLDLWDQDVQGILKHELS